MPENESAVVSVDEILDGPLKGELSRGSLYQAIRENRFPHIHFGRRLLIPRHGFEDFLAGKWQAPAGNGHDH